MALDNRPQPPVETPAQRQARDKSQRRGDWQGSSKGNLVYVAPGSTGGRNDREFGRRGGDVYYTYDANRKAVRKVDANGRNNRVYTDYNTGVSALGGAKADRFDELKAGSRKDSNS